MLLENTHYEFIPADENNWHVRILDGYYIETVIEFGKLKVADGGEHLTYDFSIISTPLGNIDPDEDTDLQEYAGMILSSILEKSVEGK
jgi:hypothetical protein